MVLFECSICQELFEFGTNDHVSALPCGHTFHTLCINKWLGSSSTCPQCRITVLRSNVIPRLFFSCIDEPSKITDDTHHNDNLRSHIYDASLDRSEIVRLRSALSALQACAKSAEETIHEQATEISTISSLYRQTNELYRHEHEKLLKAQARMLDFCKLLKEAEDMKGECLELRKKLNELQEIESLVKSTEDAATELMQKYSNPSGGFSTETMHSLFRLMAVLRAELSEAQNKSRKYRTDVHRLRLAQIASTKRVTFLEEQLKHDRNHVTQMEAEIADLLQGHARGARALSVDDSSVNVSTTPCYTHRGAKAITPGSDSKLRLKHCLSLIDLSTPEMNSSILKRKVESVEVTQVPVRVNPFKRDSTPASSDAEERKHPPRKISRRRSSSLYKLSIMRDFKKKKPKHHVFTN